MKKLFLVDVSSMFFRAFYALPPLTNEKGMPTNALYGFLSMTIKLLRDIKPDYIAFCFDSKEPSFRSEIFPEYKANRAEMPEDLVPQIPYVHKLTEHLGVAIAAKPGFEADDLIGTLAKFGRARGLEVVIVSCDKDFAQLVGPKVTMYDTMKEIKYDVDGVKAKWGVAPEQMIDYLALVGDASDNVPGVQGIGPKGAQKLLHEFETLAGIYENLDKISGKAMKARLEAGHKDAFLSQKLVSIHQDVPLGLELEDLKLKPVDRDALRDILLELGFKTFVRQLTGESASEERRAQPAVEAPSDSGNVAVGTEIEEHRCDLKGLGRLIGDKAEVWGLLDERGFYLGVGKQVVLVDCEAEALGPWLSQRHIRWHGFDLKTIWHQLNLETPVAVWDTLLAAYILRPGNVGSFSEVYTENMKEPLPDLMTPVQLFRTHLDLAEKLSRELPRKGGTKVFETIEIPLIPVLYDMERKGVRLDGKELASQNRALTADIHRLEKEIFIHAGGPFNVASPKQLAQVLFGKLKLTPGKKTKTGFSTDVDVLEKLAPEHAIAALLLEYRELTKLKSTYVDALPALADPRDGRVHTQFNQAATSTGRLSSQNPNLQNIPIRTERGRLVRRAFIADDGCVLVAADYSQIELRILAHITGDAALTSAFAGNLDIHSATASEVFGVDLKDVTPEMRRKAKAVNFGIAYGQGVFGLAESLGISRQESTEIIDRYFARFKGVKQYMKDTVETAQRQGFVETLFGRRRYIDELKSKNGAIRKFGERAAINAPIQGTASDLVKLGMIRLHQELPVPLLLQVHDELLFEVPKADVGKCVKTIRERMEGVAELKVPLKVNVGSGLNWDETKDMNG